MRISAKGRYAIAAMIELAEGYQGGGYIPVISISERLDISKIYLEQVFSLLKRSGLVNSIKGSHGGYILTKRPEEITILEVISATEAALFEEAKDTVSEKASEIDQAMNEQIFAPLDEAIRKTLSQRTLMMLLTEVQRLRNEEGIMFYI